VQLPRAPRVSGKRRPTEAACDAFFRADDIFDQEFAVHDGNSPIASAGHLLALLKAVAEETPNIDVRFVDREGEGVLVHLSVIARLQRNLRYYPFLRSKSFMNETSASTPARGNAL